jgi:ATP-dependent Clp protease ATP-binding subunit ClpA
MIFLEMGQFKTKESMSGFIGAPPGYVGYGEGKLTNGLREKPECVVLFDEIEKADSQVFDTLLRFADEGMISDPAGPVRDGRKCIIVLTTNAGQAWLHGQSQGADSTPLAEQQYLQAAKAELARNNLRPEFLGRVDERIVFLPFNEQTCRHIVDGVLERELAKFRDLKGIRLDVPEEVRAFLARQAYERRHEEGARGAPRAVNDHIVTKAIDTLAELDDEGDPSRPTVLRASMIGKNLVKIET